MTAIDTVGDHRARIDRRRYRREAQHEPGARSRHADSTSSRAADALQDEFAGVFSQETIDRYIAESIDLLGGARINVFVPVLAHRFARERLKALAQAEGVIMKEQPEVLFVCVHNAGRSQMAAGLVKLRSEGRIHVRSAGSDPGERDQPGRRRGDGRARRRHERGVPQAAHRRGRAGRRRRDHDGLRRRLPDLSRARGTRTGSSTIPAGQDIETVRRIRDEIDARVRTLIDELLAYHELMTLPLARRAASRRRSATFALVFAGCGAIMVDAEDAARSATSASRSLRARDHGR